uniref:Uncharacterized protein n=1 Tax=Triticum urartu TaxID=4572 RepID=A0A8R7P1I4_TRIUA
MPRSAISRHRRRENRPSEQVASTKVQHQQIVLITKTDMTTQTIFIYEYVCKKNSLELA